MKNKHFFDRSFLQLRVRSFLCALCVIITVVHCSSAHANETNDRTYIIDSDMTFEEATKGYCPPEILARQTLVDVQYYSFDRMIHRGQVVIDKRLASDIKTVFEKAFEEGFPIFSVIPISIFNNNDDCSMSANNTSAFNYRTMVGNQNNLSNHALGFAIDFNPLQNPYIKENTILPPDANYDTSTRGTLTRESIITRTFLSLGWTWGGDWNSLKDYQHFEKIPADE